jgi:hypothetical protein
MTAVEFLESKIFGDEIFSLSKVIEQAKEMEKKQIIDAVKFGNKDAHCVKPIKEFEQYYNETFKNI